MKATLTSKGQITLPKKARTEIGLQTGDKLEVSIEGNEIRLTKPSSDESSIAKFMGSLAGAMTLSPGTDLDEPTFTSDDWEDHPANSVK